MARQCTFGELAYSTEKGGEKKTEGKKKVWKKEKRKKCYWWESNPSALVYKTSAFKLLY